MGYSASQHQASNKSYGVTNKPDGARTYFLDFGDTFAYRPFINRQEVLDYFVTSSDRTGHFTIIINTGGTILPNGKISGGINTEWWWKDGYGDNDLVEKHSSAGLAVTVGHLEDIDPALTINWKTDIVPGDSITYQDKHGDIDTVLVQLLIPNPLISGSFSPSLNWGIIPTDPPQLIIDAQGAEGFYTIVGKGTQSPVINPLFNDDNELQENGILVDSITYNLS